MLELKNIVYKVSVDDTEREIIKDVSMTIEDDSLTVITGPNGGGKSTLAKIIAGIERPASGSIVFDGADITQMSVTERARAGIGFAFQQPVRFKGLTVKDLIQLAASRELTPEDACVYLSEVGLCAVNYIDRELDASLSGGELKRIEIAMLIARGTKLSIFDEPEAGIDLWSFHNLIRVFEHLRGQMRGSIMIISHQERILEIADKIVVVADGKITQIGDRSEILPSLLDDSEECEYYKGTQ
jgi:ABC-type transport system involved in Fe-S cluster assembly, ATPase component